MMAIDAGIYQLAGRGVKSVADYDQEAAQARQNKLAELVSGMKLDEYKRGVEGDNALAKWLSSGKSDAEITSGLAGQGYGKQALAYTDRQQKLAKERADTDKITAETLDKNLSIFRSVVPQVRTPEDAAAYTKAMYEHPIIGKFAQQFGGLDDLMRKNAESFAKDPRAWVVASAGISADKLAAMLEGKRQNTNLGGVSRGETVNYYGEVVPDQTTVAPITQSADSKASVGATMRGQNMTDARARQQMAQSATQHAETLAQGGKPPPGYRFTSDGNLQAIPGGPADLKNSAEGIKKVNEARDVLALLDEVDALLPKATGSYLGAGIDAAAGSVGYGTEGAKYSSQLKALEGALISKMPKMSGPQSDKDVLLYKQMAGQIGDQTIPVNRRQAAASMIRKLNEKYAGMAPGSSLSASHVDSLLDKYK